MKAVRAGRAAAAPSGIAAAVTVRLPRGLDKRPQVMA